MNLICRIKSSQKQLEKASKIAKFAFILGEDEINTNTVSVKNLASSVQKKIERKNLRSEYIHVN